MSKRGGNQPISNFTAGLRLPGGFGKRSDAPGSVKVQAAITWMAEKRPPRQNHWPALVLALIAQAEALLQAEGLDSLPDVFAAHPEEVSRNGRVVNTLNLTRAGEEQSIQLRPIYNAVLSVIRNDMLRQHPKNEAHATQSWPAYRELVTLISAMTPAERKTFAGHIWQTGVLDAEELVLASKRDRVVRPFEFVLIHMPTTGISRLPGGAMLQGITYGYFRADSPNLILETHSVNTGSSRAGKLGDVDGYRGGEVELAAEVKDLDITDAEAVADFIEDIADAPNATAVVVCQSITDEARSEIESRNITVLTVDDLTRTVSVWDMPKQQEGLRGVDYYLGRIQRSRVGQKFFRDWLHEHGLDAGFAWIEATEAAAEAAAAEEEPVDG
jgi:hypothetical protein